MSVGISLVVLAAVLQGIFLLPRTRMRGWDWEHIWLGFSLTGMLICNWTLTFLLLPDPFAIYAAVPHRELAILAGFGLAWGMGAVLFGLGMDMLGLSLGYPLIMGLNASIGTFVPLLWLYGASMFAGRRLFIVLGTAIAIAGIVTCSVAGTRRASAARQVPGASRSCLLAGLTIAVASGVLSCLPNIGLSFGSNTLRSAQSHGASPAIAGNSVWFIFFSCGCIVNILYCFWQMARHHSVARLLGGHALKNWFWTFSMGAMWIASFYLYGMGTSRMGSAGATIGWPILVSVSIGVGVVFGMAGGEWRDAPRSAKTLLWGGLALIITAVLIIPFGTAGR